MGFALGRMWLACLGGTWKVAWQHSSRLSTEVQGLKHGLGSMVQGDACSGKERGSKNPGNSNSERRLEGPRAENGTKLHSTQGGALEMKGE